MMRLLEALEPVGMELRRALHRRIVTGGDTVRQAADWLHGTWLGHPLHPVLTDLTIGAWTYGLVFDLLGFVARLPGVRRAAGLLNGLGTLSAIPTALTGLTDYSAIKQDSVEEGTLHAVANSTAFLMHLLAWRARWRDKTLASLWWSGLGTGVATYGAWLGGELVYRLRVGVNHAESVPRLEAWTPVAAESDLAEGVPLRVEVAGAPIMLLRQDGDLYAIAATCAHAGGPLDEGTIIDGACVQCPWHASVFDLRNGAVVHGPAVFSQPAFWTRIQDGQVEICSAPASPTPLRELIQDAGTKVYATVQKEL